MHHPLLFFVDEQNYTWPELGMFSWEQIAYIKCFENDFIGDDDFIRFKNTPPTESFLPLKKESVSPPQLGDLKIPDDHKTPVIIAIYTRKGADYQTMPGGMNKIPVRGYSTILKFAPDRQTLFWEPLFFGNYYRLRFNNNEYARRFRVVMEGFNYKGEIVHFEQVLE
jgi:hypothetical protein